MSGGTAFSLDNFTRNLDGTYTKKKTVEQPRDLSKSCVTVGNKGSNHKWIEINGVATQMSNEGLKAYVKKNPKKKAKEVYFKNQDIKQVYADAEIGSYIYIPGNVPSLKNSKQIFTNKKTGKSFNIKRFMQGVHRAKKDSLHDI